MKDQDTTKAYTFDRSDTREGGSSSSNSGKVNHHSRDTSEVVCGVPSTHCRIPASMFESGSGVRECVPTVDFAHCALWRQMPKLEVGNVREMEVQL